MTRSGEGREMAAALQGAGCTVHDPDDLGESDATLESERERFDRLFIGVMQADADELDAHPPITCAVCGGKCEWRLYDGYRCRACDTPHNEDGTVYEV